ncbi:TPA: hypothetical protein ACTYJU_001225 [Citrobacter koseri]
MALIALTGCKPGADKAIELAQKEVSADMKDPESAKFRYMRFIKEGEKDGLVGGFVCGNVNAKNSYGAYAGYSPFFIAISMKSKGIFSKGVTYTVYDKKVFSEPSEIEMKSYLSTCGQDGV